MIGTDGGIITNFLASYAKQSNSQNSEAYKIGDGNSANQNENLNKDTMEVNVNLKGLESVAQQTNHSDVPYGWIFSIAAICIALGVSYWLISQHQLKLPVNPTKKLLRILR